MHCVSRQNLKRNTSFCRLGGNQPIRWAVNDWCLLNLFGEVEVAVHVKLTREQKNCCTLTMLDWRIEHQSTNDISNWCCLFLKNPLVLPFYVHLRFGANSLSEPSGAPKTYASRGEILQRERRLNWRAVVCGCKSFGILRGDRRTRGYSSPRIDVMYHHLSRQ
jgi:hypothetical protein